MESEFLAKRIQTKIVLLFIWRQDLRHGPVTKRTHQIFVENRYSYWLQHLKEAAYVKGSMCLKMSTNLCTSCYCEHGKLCAIPVTEDDRIPVNLHLHVVFFYKHYMFLYTFQDGL